MTRPVCLITGAFAGIGPAGAPFAARRGCDVALSPTSDRAGSLASGVAMQHTGSAKAVARAILWRISEDASYATGATLNMTGGR